MIAALTNISAFSRNPFDFLIRQRERFGNIFNFRLGPFPVTFFADPKDIECIYNNPKAFQRSKIIRVIKAVTGESI